MNVPLLIIAGTFLLFLVALVAFVVTLVRAREAERYEAMSVRPEWTNAGQAEVARMDTSLEGLVVAPTTDAPSASLLAPLQTGDWMPPAAPVEPKALGEAALQRRIEAYRPAPDVPEPAFSIEQYGEWEVGEPEADQLAQSLPDVAFAPEPVVIAPDAAPTIPLPSIVPAPVPANVSAPQQWVEAVPSIDVPELDLAALAESLPEMPTEDDFDREILSLLPDDTAALGAESSFEPAVVSMSPLPPVAPVTAEPSAAAAAVPTVPVVAEPPSPTAAVPAWEPPVIQPTAAPVIEQVGAESPTALPVLEPPVVTPVASVPDTPAAVAAVEESAVPVAAVPSSPESFDDEAWTALLREQQAIASAPAPREERVPVVVHAEPEPAPARVEPPAAAPARPPRPVVVVAGQPVAAPELRASEPSTGRHRPIPDELPIVEMAAPVEMWFGDSRVGVKAGTATYDRFRKYADVLLEDLEAAKSARP